MQINIATKELVVAVSKQSFEDKLFAGTSGNLSIFDREQDALYITPTSPIQPATA